MNGPPGLISDGWFSLNSKHTNTDEIIVIFCKSNFDILFYSKIYNRQLGNQMSIKLNSILTNALILV